MTTLAELALEEFHKRSVNFQPLYPAVLVRVLPKEKVSDSGLIYLPDEKVNKPIYEGIVLRTYLPHTMVWKGKHITLTSGLEVGDHVLFPHWSGEPVPGLHDESNTLANEEYRLIPAKSFLGSAGIQEAGEILGTLTYEKESVRDKLKALVTQTAMVDDNNSDLFFDRLFAEFDILVKVKASRTHSGA